ncbi:oxidoreductase [Pelobium manganitolerans]|uniref:Oxidoreductase n=1 Tax=Pelobium manganitolerans TaxID=1842495 RepID=A0A419S263_9SPHI|nr:Gfo/Idh/MocA family oxidoreductase [Pelobium manganitolerans]RKD12800.1 oxidoreductase [Pelobium manganitolerans]
MKKIKIGMVGGGQGAFIGAVHRNALLMDGLYDFCCGAFSSDATKSKESGKSFGLNESRIYSNYQELFEKESLLPAQERMEAVALVTPNHLHYHPAKLALEYGFHVVLDKPITLSLKEAKQLQKVYERSGKKLMLTHTYTGYPMVKEAKQQVKKGAIGTVRKIYVEYPQGWLSTQLEKKGSKQAQWRTNPETSGLAGAMGDIGTHAFNLAEYISGLQLTQVCADINKVVEGRVLDDDGAVLLKFNNGASGALIATQVAAGEENNLNIRIYGDKGGLVWEHNNPNTLRIKLLDKAEQIYRTGGAMLHPQTNFNTRTPAGHPEGYIEAFANLYRNFAFSINQQHDLVEYPGMEEGIRGMAFIESVIQSGESNLKWTDFKVYDGNNN